jgi:hypothetical protein
VIKSYQTAQLLAQKLLVQAHEKEPKITADLQSISEKVVAQMVGLENKFKTEESLTRKLVTIATKGSEDILKEAKKINDALRYTFVSAIESYLETVIQTIEILEKMDYQIPRDKIWNAWQNIGKHKDRGYRGINITIISSQKQRFELQFHTKASFSLKTKTHDLYKEARRTETSSERREEIKGIVLAKAAEIDVPKGVKRWSM